MYFEIAKNKFKYDRELPTSQANETNQIEKIKSNLLEYLSSQNFNSRVLIMYWKDGTDENFKYIFERVFGKEIIKHTSVEIIK